MIDRVPGYISIGYINYDFLARYIYFAKLCLAILMEF